MPRWAGKRREFLAKLATEQRVLILYESPQRLAATLTELAEIMGNRQILVVRELTKAFEEHWRGPVGEVAQALAGREVKGECTLVLSRPAKPGGADVDLAAELQRAAKQRGLAGRRLAEEVAARLELPRRRVYQAYLELKGRKKPP